MIKLKYGNTNTFYIPCHSGGLLVDTDYAGTMPAFYKTIKQRNIKLNDIAYVLATHYHPDHMGLIGQLMEKGVNLLLLDVQQASVHFSDHIFERERLPFTTIHDCEATIISCEKSREFLFSIGISGQILHTPSHSEDSVSLILDDGRCFVGDIEPPEYVDGYEEDEALKKDWANIMSFTPNTIFYSHRPEVVLG